MEEEAVKQGFERWGPSTKWEEGEMASFTEGGVWVSIQGLEPGAPQVTQKFGNARINQPSLTVDGCLITGLQRDLSCNPLIKHNLTFLSRNWREAHVLCDIMVLYYFPFTAYFKLSNSQKTEVDTLGACFCLLKTDAC